MTNPKWLLPRRTFLRGMGTALALPFLEQMVPLRAMAAGARPLRMALIYHPNGWPFDDRNNAYEVPYRQGVEAMTPFKDDYLLLYGFRNLMFERQNGRPDQGAGDGHGANSITFMNGQLPQALGNNNWGVPTTADQVIAQEVFGSQRFPSLGVNLFPRGGIDTYHQPIYTQCVYWKGPNQPVKLHDRPLDLFNLMVAGGTTPTQTTTAEQERRARKKSVLDFVLSDIRSFRTKLGTSDKQRVDEYLTSVEKIERDIASLPTEPSVTCSVGSAPPSLANDMSTYVQRYQIFNDLLLKAFQCDLTRIFQFMVGHETMPMSYVPGVQTDLDWHAHSHDNYANNQKINDWHFSRFKELIAKMKSIREGDGNTLLQNSMLIFHSSYGDSSSHWDYNQQFFIAGSGGGRYKNGTAINLSGYQTADIWLTIMNDFGVRRSTFGNGTRQVTQMRVGG